MFRRSVVLHCREPLHMLIATFSGVRFKVDEHDPDVAYSYTTAFARYIAAKSIKNVVVGFDGRNSAHKYIPHILASLKQFNVRFIGCVPTPTVQQLVKNSGAAAGVIVTASHNDATWCGLKFVDDNSIFLDPVNCKTVYGDVKQEEADKTVVKSIIEALQRKITLPWLTVDSNQTAIREHIDSIVATGRINIQLIKDSKLKISFSGANASGAAYIKLLCEYLNVQLVDPFGMEIGNLPAHPEPTPDNLREFEKHCANLDIDAAFAVDPDADRCVLLADGKCIFEDLTLAAAISSYLELYPQRQIVKNVSTSLAINAAADRFGAETVQTAVGEVNVCLKMLEIGAEIGGEGNGGVILQPAHLGRDSIVCIMLVLQWMALSKKPLGQLIAGLKTYSIVKAKYEFQMEDKPQILEKLNRFAELQKEKGKNIITIDGVKIEDKQSWVHVRFSNTEPIVRIFAEAESKELAQNDVKEVSEFFGW